MSETTGFSEEKFIKNWTQHPYSYATQACHNISDFSAAKMMLLSIWFLMFLMRSEQMTQAIYPLLSQCINEWFHPLPNRSQQHPPLDFSHTAYTYWGTVSCARVIAHGTLPRTFLLFRDICKTLPCIRTTTTSYEYRVKELISGYP